MNDLERLKRLNAEGSEIRKAQGTETAWLGWGPRGGLTPGASSAPTREIY
jgi:hypothetical protein